MIRLSFFFLLFTCFVLFPSKVQAIDFHFIIIAQDDDPSTYSAKDKVKMERLAEDIAISTGMTLKKHYFSKASLTTERLKGEINAITCGEDDVIWFYYVGNGTNFDGRFPMFKVGDSDAVGLSKIHEKLKTKNARLTITMFDCCNHGPGITSLGAVRDEKLPFIVYNQLVRGIDEVYKALFLKSYGDIKMCSSKQGQYSMGISTGGLFTSSFISCLNKMQDEKTVSWAKLFDNTRKETQKMANSLHQDQILGNCNCGADGRCNQWADAQIVVFSNKAEWENSKNIPTENNEVKTQTIVVKKPSVEISILDKSAQKSVGNVEIRQGGHSWIMEQNEEENSKRVAHIQLTSASPELQLSAIDANIEGQSVVCIKSGGESHYVIMGNGETESFREIKIVFACSAVR